MPDTFTDQNSNMRLWPHFRAAPRFIPRVRKSFGQNPKIFTIGSCFAIEVRKAMAGRGLVVYPEYQSVAFNPTTQIYDKIPPQLALMHYDTFAIRQEFECAFGLWTDRAESFCEVRDAGANERLKADVVYKDPTRRMIYGKTRTLLADLSRKIDEVFRAGLEAADVIVITLGLTEVWQHKYTGRYFCAPPRFGLGGGDVVAVFRESTFRENYANMRATVELLRKHYPQKPIVLSVSPVHLECTFTPTDVGTASLESKSILRAVAGQIAKDYDGHVTYFPSYEMAQFSKEPVFEEDGRHVRGEFAARVVAAFMENFAAEP